MSTDELVTQQFPYPHELEELVSKLSYRPGWRFSLETGNRLGGYLWRGTRKGLYLLIMTHDPDSYNLDRIGEFPHFRIVPAENFNRQAWQRWLFEQILQVEQHEAMEFFMIDGERPYAPLHAPGTNPYVVTELVTAEEKSIEYNGFHRDSTGRYRHGEPPPAQSSPPDGD